MSPLRQIAAARVAGHGVMSALSARYRMSSVPQVGSSGGGLVALLGACEVPPAEAVGLAFGLCREAGVYSRQLGLLGVWRGLVHRWLSSLLPPDAPSRCRHVGLVVTQLPYLQPVRLSDWRCRGDLIESALASAHIPLLLDGRPAARCRGRWVVDGNLHFGWLGRGEGLVPQGGRSLVFDPRADPQLPGLLGSAPGACLRALDAAAAHALVARGREYGEQLLCSGALEGTGLERYARHPTASTAAVQH